MTQINTQVEEHVTDELYASLSNLSCGTIFHTQGWHQVLEECFHWQVRAIVMRSIDKALLAWLPFVQKRRLGLKKINIALPISYRVGFVRRPEFHPNLDALAHLAPFEIHEELSNDHKVLISDDVYTTIDLTQAKSSIDLFNNMNRSNIRKRVRKAMREGCICVQADKKDDFASYITLVNQTRKRQGSPTYPQNFFKAIYEHLHHTGHVKLFYVQRDKRVVAGALLFYWGDTAYFAYGTSTSDREEIRLGINQLAWWTAINDAFRCGYKIFDFGTSPTHQESLWKYKERYGGISKPYYKTILGMNPARASLSTDSVIVKLASQILRRLPDGLFATLTPHLLRRVI